MNRTAIERFAEIWNSTIKKADLDRYGWDANPWVWVIEFEQCKKPEGV
nr:MAG TPA: ASCH domain protein [Caudoviricetes sp.]